ncbi:MAG: TIGR02587 family membrane protein [Proteobacteria bacterium]|nr:MAG: TIGR02587 family membrane protein [Pseudomonadota bacterium]
MGHLKEQSNTERDNRHFLRGLGRAAAGSVIFSLPLLMTMEMWNLGFYLDPVNRAVMLVMSIPLLVGLSHVFGFEETFGWQDDLIDTFVALCISFVSSGAILYLIGLINSKSSLEELFGKIQLQIIPGSIGALLAQSQLGTKTEKEKDSTSYLSELFIMAVGALFLSLSIAPTEEVMLIAVGLSPLQAFVIALVSLGLMHLFVYSIDIKGTEKTQSMIAGWRLFLKFTVTGYAIVLTTSFLVLKILDRLEGLGACEALMMTVVLGLPSAIGAASARLVI